MSTQLSTFAIKPPGHNFDLTDEEVEQCMVIYQLSHNTLSTLLGVVSLSSNVVSALLEVDIIEHTDSVSSILTGLRELGRTEGARVLSIIQPSIHKQFKDQDSAFPRGLADPRVLVRAVAALIEAELGGIETLTRPRLIVTSVYVARSGRITHEI